MVVTENSIETISRLIRKEFDSIDRSFDWLHGESERIIQVARDFGLNDLADEMENDLKIGK